MVVMSRSVGHQFSIVYTAVHKALVKMSTPDSFDGPANKDFDITYYIILGFVLLCITPLLLWFTTNIQQIFRHMTDALRCIYLETTQVFRTLYQWYALWREIKQLQPIRQPHTNRNTDH